MDVLYMLTSIVGVRVL